MAQTWMGEDGRAEGYSVGGDFKSSGVRVEDGLIVKLVGWI